ncbi:MAG: hypothetical protein ACFE8U_18070 [Candidatus Hermodarchaeota archaeon]
MTAEQARCFYHPNRVAVTKCERCNRLICLEDKTIYRRYGGMDRADDIYTYCPACYNILRKQGAEMAPRVFGGMCVIFLIFVIGAFAVFIFFVMMMMNATSDGSSSGSVSMGQFLPFLLLPMIFFIGIVIIGGLFLFFFLKRNQKSIQETTSNQMNQFTPSSRFQDTISCDQCGAVLQPTEMFCPTCGRRTKGDFG